MTETAEAELARCIAALKGMLADLDGYIGREAGKKAAPAIAEAERAANEAIQEARAEVQRQQDLVTELRRRLHALEQQRGNGEVAWNRVATALGHRHYRDQPVEALAAEVERRLAERHANA